MLSPCVYIASAFLFLTTPLFLFSNSTPFLFAMPVCIPIHHPYPLILPCLVADRLHRPGRARSDSHGGVKGEMTAHGIYFHH